MEPGKVVLPSHIACSFEPTLHAQYEAIRAQCDPWILALTQPTSPAATEFWVECLFPLLGCLAYPDCLPERLLLITKLLAWFFVSDDHDDDLALLGCDTPDVVPVSPRRHHLILDCCAGTLSLQDGVDNPSTVKQMKALHAVCLAMLKDMPPPMQARFLQATKEYLDAVTIQAQYRRAQRLPKLDEYVALRRSASGMLMFYILIEYGLGIELDQETLHSDHFLQLLDASIDHVALSNDVISCQVEISSGDLHNLPSIIFFNSASRSQLTSQEAAMERALCMVEEVDKRCVQLMAEVEKSNLIQKPGVEAYVRGLQSWIAGNKAWSLKTARYTHKCSAEQGIVHAVLQRGAILER